MRTSELIQRISRADNEREALDAVGEDDRLMELGEYLKALLERRQMSISELAMAVRVERTALYRILSKGGSTSRNTLIRLCFALRLTADEAQTLLKYGRRCALSPRDRRDALLLFCLQRQYDLAHAEDILREMGERGLYERA